MTNEEWKNAVLEAKKKIDINYITDHSLVYYSRGKDDLINTEEGKEFQRQYNVKVVEIPKWRMG